MDIPLNFLNSPRLMHFLAIYESRNLRLAAEALGVSQPALTKSLKNLELYLDIKLFDRSSKGMQPTTAAQAVHRHIENLIDLSHGLQIELSALRGVGEGLIRLGAGQMWTRLFIPQIVSEFQMRFPDVSLEISTGPMPHLVEELKAGKLDLVVGDFDGISVSECYDVELIWCSEFWAFAGSDHQLAAQENVEMIDLVKHAWTGYVDGDVFARKVISFCDEFELDHPKISIRATSLVAMLKLTIDSGNIAVLPKELETEAMRSGLLALSLNRPTLWTINTGSIIEAKKTSISHYQVLLDLIKTTGSEPNLPRST